MPSFIARRLARLRWRIDTGTAQSWYFFPSATSSTDSAAWIDSTWLHGAEMIRNGFRTSSRSGLARTTGSRVKAEISGNSSTSAATPYQGACPWPPRIASPQNQSVRARSSTPERRVGRER